MTESIRSLSQEEQTKLAEFFFNKDTDDVSIEAATLFDELWNRF